MVPGPWYLGPVKPNVIPLTTPMSETQLAVLRVYATPSLRDYAADATPQQKLEWAKATQALVARGALQKTPGGIVVTPEGLAHLLDVAGIDSVPRTAP